jgi:hypothetical protein
LSEFFALFSRFHAGQKLGAASVKTIISSDALGSAEQLRVHMKAKAPRLEAFARTRRVLAERRFQTGVVQGVHGIKVPEKKIIVWDTASCVSVVDPTSACAPARDLSSPETKLV